jgi:hypothetical protein
LHRKVTGAVRVRQEGETTVVTLHEEMVVVETRLRATEEVRITRRRSPTFSRAWRTRSC